MRAINSLRLAGKRCTEAEKLLFENLNSQTPTAIRQFDLRDGNLNRAVRNLISYKALRDVGVENERIQSTSRIFALAHGSSEPKPVIFGYGT
jgi:hypothetical protein